jgi:hypothetical protein
VGIPANHPAILAALANGQAKDTTPRRTQSPRIVAPSWSITLTVPTQVVSEANQREHWRAKYNRGDIQRTALILAWNAAGLSLGQKPYTRSGVRVRWVKLGGKRLDSDNLAGAFKQLRDCLAGWLGLDDGDERIAWEYAQEPGGPVGVRVTITQEC